MSEENKNEQVIKDINDLVVDFKAFKDKAVEAGEMITKTAFDEFATKMDKKFSDAQHAKDEAGIKNDIFGTESKAIGFYEFLAGGPCQSDATLKASVPVRKDAPLNVANPVDGGYLVPLEYSNDLSQLIKQYGVSRQLHDVINLTSGKSLDFPNVSNADDAYFQTTEGTTINQADLDFGHVVITPAEVVALLTSSNKLMRQSRISVAEIVAKGLTQKAGRLEDYVTFNGTGGNDAANGSQKGYTVDSTVTENEVSLANFQLSDLATLMNSVDDQVFENDNSAFYMGRKTYTQLLGMKIDGKKNWYGYGQPGTIVLGSNGRPTAWGKVINIVGALKGANAADAGSSGSSDDVDAQDGYVLYGNLRNAGKIVTLGQFAVEASTHVLFNKAQTVWRVNYDSVSVL